MKLRSAEMGAGWLGFDSRQGRLLAGEVNGRTGEVLPAGFLAIEAKPQVAFRGQRLYVHQPIASSFLIHSARVGRVETTVSGAAPIPADAFATHMDALARIDELFARDKVIEVKIDRTVAELLGAPWTLPVAPPGIGNRPLRFLAGFLSEVPPW